jgi:hypothetical protein
VQTHQAPGGRAALLVTREPRAKDAAPADLAKELSALPVPADTEREILHDLRVEIGSLEGEDVALVRRSKQAAEYHRIVRVPYYELDLAFQGASRHEDRALVDACMEEVLATVRFRRR